MHIIYAVQPITRENLDELKRIHPPETVMRTPRDIPFKVGNVLVIRKIHIPDPFETSMKTTLESVWLVTHSSLLEKFDFDRSVQRSQEFKIITLKKS